MANVNKKIPSNTQPTWQADINGKRYEYQSGITADVPDEVAALIDFIDESAPKRDPKAAQRAIEDEVTQIVKDNFAGGVGYEEASEVVMLPETSFEIAAVNPEAAILSGSFSYTLEVGQDYTVTLDGEAQTCTAIAGGDGMILTNTSLADAMSGNGWLIMAGDGEVALQTLDSSFIGTHTISISGEGLVPHKIDSKFIPATEKEDMPLYIKNNALSASDNGAALDAALLAELLKTKHCYILYPTGDEKHMEILSYQVYHKNNVVVAVECYFINTSSGGVIASTQNGEIQGS